MRSLGQIRPRTAPHPTPQYPLSQAKTLQQQQVPSAVASDVSLVEPVQIIIFLMVVCSVKDFCVKYQFLIPPLDYQTYHLDQIISDKGLGLKQTENSYLLQVVDE